MILSPEATEAQNEAARNERYKELRYQQGPYLSEDQSRIIVPSVWYNRALVDRLKAQRFQFSPGDNAHWERSTALPLDGKRYSPTAWLTWAIRQYAHAWPDWSAKQNKDEGA